MLPDQPCGKPKPSTLNEPRFADLGHPLPSLPNVEKKPSKKKRKAKVGDQAETQPGDATLDTDDASVAAGGSVPTDSKKGKKKGKKGKKDKKEKEKKPEKEKEKEKKTKTTMNETKDKKEKKGKETKAEKVKPTKNQKTKADHDQPLAGTTTRTTAKDESKEKVRVKTKADATAKTQISGKSKASAKSLPEGASPADDDAEGQSRRRSPRKRNLDQPPKAEASNASVKTSARQKSKSVPRIPTPSPSVADVDDVESQPKTKTKPKPKPKSKVKPQPKNDASSEHPDVEMLDDRGSVDLSTRNPGQVRVQRAFVEVPALKKHNRSKQDAASPDVSTKPTGSLGVQPSGSTSTTPALTKVGPPRGVKRRRGGEQQAPKQAQDVHPLLDAGDDDGADAPTLKRRKAATEEADVNHGSGEVRGDEDGNPRLDHDGNTPGVGGDGIDDFGMDIPSVYPCSITLSPHILGEAELMLVLRHLEFPLFEPPAASHSGTPSLLDQTNAPQTDPRRSGNTPANSSSPDHTPVALTSSARTSKRATSVLRLTPVTGTCGFPAFNCLQLT